MLHLKQNNKIKVFVFLSLLLSFSNYVWSQPKNEKPDLEKLKQEALKGEARAQLDYGLALRDTQTEEAKKFIQKAADQGLGEAWYWLVYGGFTNKEPSSYFLSKAVDLGYEKVLPDLLEDLLFRAGKDANIELAKKYGDLARRKKIKLGLDDNGTNEVLLTIDRCFEAGKPNIPQGDLPSAEEKKLYTATGVDCDDYQTGIGVEKDLKKYAKCVLSSPDTENTTIAELYANGWGVKRNAKLAMSLVCHGSGVPAELELMIDTLYSSKDKAELNPPFIFCNHVTSAMNGGPCSYIEETREQKKRALVFKSVTEKWTENEKKIFTEMRDIAEIFFKNHAIEENDMTGTARASIATGIKSGLRSELLKNLQAFEKGNFPTNQDFSKADKELNVIYKELMQRKNFQNFGTVSKEGIKTTQRLWLKYRDAWTKFALLKYPKISADVWNTWMTEARNEQLKAITAE